MAITIQGDNKGIAVDGNLTIEKLDFVFGQGVRSTSGVKQEIPEAEVVEAEEIPVVDGREEHYPEVTDTNTNFFVDTFIVTSDVIGVPRKRLDVPKVEILHIIYNNTREWEPSKRTSVRKWKILYLLLKSMQYFKIVEVKERYGDFVEAVIKYCFPDVPSTYGNNISHCKLPDSFMDWEESDKQLRISLRKALTFEK